MKLEVVTPKDLVVFKNEIRQEIQALLLLAPKEKRWLKSKDIRAKFNISNGTLEHLRATGAIPFSKLGGSYFYELGALEEILEAKTQSAL